jgi:hypothetical protein
MCSVKVYIVTNLSYNELEYWRFHNILLSAIFGLFNLIFNELFKSKSKVAKLAKRQKNCLQFR